MQITALHALRYWLQQSKRVVFVLLGSFAIAQPVLAFKPLEFDPSKNKTGLSSTQYLTFLSGGTDPLSITLNLINLALSLLGTISFIMILYAGFLYFSAGDNEESVTKAKDILIGAVIGLVITLGALGLSTLLFALLDSATAAAVTPNP